MNAQAVLIIVANLLIVPILLRRIIAIAGMATTAMEIIAHVSRK